jgi:hypothetical protein
MSLLVYNNSNTLITIIGTSVIVPASTSPPLFGKATDVTSELRPDVTVDPVNGINGGLLAADYLNIMAQLELKFVWSGSPEYNTPGLVSNSAVSLIKPNDPATISTTTIYVRTTGDDNLGDGSLAYPYATVAHAVLQIPLILSQRNYVFDITGVTEVVTALPAWSGDAPNRWDASSAAMYAQVIFRADTMAVLSLAPGDIAYKRNVGAAGHARLIIPTQGVSCIGLYATYMVGVDLRHSIIHAHTGLPREDVIVYAGSIPDAGVDITSWDGVSTLTVTNPYVGSAGLGFDGLSISVTAGPSVSLSAIRCNVGVMMDGARLFAYSCAISGIVLAALSMPLSVSNTVVCENSLGDLNLGGRATSDAVSIKYCRITGGSVAGSLLMEKTVIDADLVLTGVDSNSIDMMASCAPTPSKHFRHITMLGNGCLTTPSGWVTAHKMSLSFHGMDGHGLLNIPLQLNYSHVFPMPEPDVQYLRQINTGICVQCDWFPIPGTTKTQRQTSVTAGIWATHPYSSDDESFLHLYQAAVPALKADDAIQGAVNDTEALVSASASCAPTMDTVVKAVLPGMYGNRVMIQFIDDSYTGIVVDEFTGVDNYPVVRVHFVAGAVNIGEVEAAIGVSIVSVETAGADPAVLLTTPSQILLSGGTSGWDDVSLAVGLVTLVSGRNLSCTFQAGWTGGDIVVCGLNQRNDYITETIVANPGATVYGQRVFLFIVSVDKTAVNAGAAKTVTIGIGDIVGALSLGRERPNTNSQSAIVFVDGVPEICPMAPVPADTGYTPVTPPDGAKSYLALITSRTGTYG